MDIAQLEIRASELRSKINEAAAADDADAGQLDEMRGEYGTVEARLRALKAIADKTPTDGDTTEAREFSELETRASVADIVDAVVSGRVTDGATAELQSELGMSANDVPLRLLEVRAATPAPADVGRNQLPILHPVFPNSSAAFMGVRMPTVPVGESVFHVLETSTVASDHDEAASVDDYAGSFSASVVKPRRIQASLEWSREDAHIFQGMESALRRNLRDSLAAGVDNYVLNKASVGLFSHGTAPSAPSAIAKYADYRGAIMDRVDGRYAAGASDVRMIVNAETYRHADSVYRAAATDESALEAVMRLSGGIRVAGHAPATASNIAQAVTRRGPDGAAVAPIWENIALIPDQITKAASGTIRLTAVMLMNAAMLRGAQFERVAFKLA